MVLVTGGTGFLGAHLLEQLLKDGQEVRCLYRTKKFNHLSHRISEQVEWIKGDLLDISSLEDALNGISEVYHCAGKVSYDPGEKDAILKINVEGTANLVNACLDSSIKKLIHVSSVAAIGRSNKGGPVNESMKWSPQVNKTAYAKSKHLAEMEVWRGAAEGLEVVIVNPSFIVGPALQWNQGSPLLIKKIAEGFSYYPAGTTGFTDVRDVAALMILLMKSNISGERFIINNENWSYQDLFLKIKELLDLQTHFKKAGPLLSGLAWRALWLKAFITGSGRQITRQTAQTGTKRVQFSNQKIKGCFPEFHFLPLEKTLQDTCEAYRRVMA